MRNNGMLSLRGLCCYLARQYEIMTLINMSVHVYPYRREDLPLLTALRASIVDGTMLYAMFDSSGAKEYICRQPKYFIILWRMSSTYYPFKENRGPFPRKLAGGLYGWMSVAPHTGLQIVLARKSHFCRFIHTCFLFISLLKFHHTTHHIRQHHGIERIPCGTSRRMLSQGHPAQG
jgi:hypothetical protein